MSASSRPTEPRLHAPYLNVARATALALTLLLLAACTQQQPSITVALDASTVELLRGAPETEVLVTLTRSGGAAADVELTLTGLPADVTATFSPAVLSGTTLTSTLTLSAPAEAAEGFHALDITAAGPGLTAEATLNVAVVGLTVTGQLHGVLTGPVANVAIASQDDSAVTDSEGRFTLKGLSVPYDITAWSTSGTWLHVYEGLTESEVVLSSTPSVITPATNGTTVSGSLTGDDIPVKANQIVMVCLEGLFSLGSQCDAVNPTEDSFSLNPQWSGATSRSARLHLLQMESDAGGMPVGYLGYRTLDLDLKDGVPVMFTEPLELGEPLETVTVELEVESPVPVAQTYAAVQVGPELALTLMIQNGADSSYDVLMPVIPGASYTFGANQGMNNLGWAAGVTGTEATVVIREAPTVTAPANGATGVTTATDFTASNPAGGPLTWLWSTGAYSVGLTSMATTVNLPDTSGYGFTLPGGGNLSLTLLGSGGETVEAGARGVADYFQTLLLVGMQASAGYPTSGSLTIVTGHSTTLAP